MLTWQKLKQKKPLRNQQRKLLKKQRSSMSENTESVKLEAGRVNEATVTPILSKKDSNKVLKIHRVMYSEFNVVEFFPEEYHGAAQISSWLKMLIDGKLVLPVGTTELQMKKLCHDNYLTVAHIMSSRCKYKLALLTPIVEAIAYANEMAKALKAEIELIEPPKVEEKQPYEMDLTHIKGDSKIEAHVES